MDKLRVIFLQQEFRCLNVLLDPHFEARGNQNQWLTAYLEAVNPNPRGNVEQLSFGNNDTLELNHILHCIKIKTYVHSLGRLKLQLWTENSEQMFLPLQKFLPLLEPGTLANIQAREEAAEEDVAVKEVGGAVTVR